ncbi:MAG: carboxypeptidase-like regulatory domain-containing protein [Bacteroidales bacterium]
MNTNQRTQLDMQLALRNCVTQNEAVAKKIPKFWENYVIVQSATDEIQAIGKAQGANKTGIASDKNKLKQNLIVLAAKNSRKIALYAKSTNSDTLLKEVEYNEGQLERLAEVTLIERAKTIHTNAEANIEKLAEHGITPETQKVFLDTITALNTVLKTPRSSIAEKKKSTERLAVLFQTVDNAIEMMDFAVGIVKDEQVDFYNVYKTSRKLVDTNTGNIALKATAKELTSGAPVHGALFTFIHEAEKLSDNTGNGEINKKTSKKGSFHIKNMRAGTYSVVVSKPGYKEKEVTVSIADGERSDLNVELEKA